MKKQILIMLGVLLTINLVMAGSYMFAQNEEVNFRFRCIDQNNSYCNSGTSLVISVEYPNGSNALDNQTMTHNPTFYNVSLPSDTLGNYAAIILSPTTNGTVSEFTYDITPTGYSLDTSKSIITFLAVLVLIIIALLFFALAGVFKHSGAKVFFLGLTLTTLAFSVGYILKMMQDTVGEFTSFTSIYSSFYTLLTILLAGAGVALVLYLVVFVLKSFNNTRFGYDETY